jgi:16S rRNA (adenine(1408)-N(1))-methyltransferase
MAESSLRAARPEHKGGLSNALFVVAAAERLPPELAGIAAEVTIAFPWGSLLRATLAPDDAAEAAAGIAGLVAPGGRVRALVSTDPRDRLDLPAPADTPAAELAARWCRHGLQLAAWRPATESEIAATGSSWARRLRAGRDRSVWQLELVRPARPESSAGASAVPPVRRLRRPTGVVSKLSDSVRSAALRP